jgi:hypothetical protein
LTLFFFFDLFCCLTALQGFDLFNDFHPDFFSPVLCISLSSSSIINKSGG